MSSSHNTDEIAVHVADTHLTDKEIQNLEQKANAIRISVIEALVEAKSGHTAGPLGMADIFAYLYFHELRHDPKKPDWSERDRLILSNGHICPVLYSSMAHAGYFGKDGVEQFTKSLRKYGSIFQGHPHREFMPELDTSSGPLGSGLSQAVGMAIAERIDAGRSYKKWIWCLTGDGELDEGNNWEAIMLAGKEKLGNLIAIVDRNNIQIDGFTEDIMPLEPLSDKWQAFNWHVIEINGHDFTDIHRAVGEAKAEFDKPTVLIANTIPGKGVPDFERKPEWHGKVPNKEEGEMALKILRELGEKITK
ncbi:MAG: transketolase [Candidatus Taylorbacteria bacterium CG11_big_fil_rev_8_21_14_0_20_46_11]|uniref:Transketolase n=1 Tax=Candidatus Taylorbacteria bacterium CG11_big_fil_rev_8_21_14_0_20_46_11 TaxID=1975025 RepID=A0A2H0KCT8_9BACT|nr:MAG: transketolase [Candidatus Taylorbacteria bacterium CG11_big_fil_rev_8_21_14_0_20_46_11]